MSRPSIIRSKSKTRGKARLSFLAICFFLFFASQCRVSPPLLSPNSSQLKMMEGYASLKIKRCQDTARLKFSFLIELPAHSRLEVMDLLGRKIYDIFIEEENAFLILPSQRVYWQGSKEEVMERLLGIRLYLWEMASLLSGSWPEAEREEELSQNWDLKRDVKRRIVSGEKDGLFFEVKDFFYQSSVPRLLDFKGFQSEGNLKVLSLSFNQPVKGGVFSLAFLKDFTPKTWEEIEKLLRNED